MKFYTVKEMFYTLQGEGTYTGVPSVFVRFTGCNLWNGREESRATSQCRFCDTDFIGTDGEGGGRYSADELAQKIVSLFPEGKPLSLKGESFTGMVVFTGGEPLLQLTQELIEVLQTRGVYVTIETNGTVPLKDRVPDWVTCSPKTSPEGVKIEYCHDLKLVFPLQDHLSTQWCPEDFHARVQVINGGLFLQPMDQTHYTSSEGQNSTEQCVQYAMLFPHWRVGLQTHKIMDIS